MADFFFMRGVLADMAEPERGAASGRVDLFWLLAETVAAVGYVGVEGGHARAACLEFLCTTAGEEPHHKCRLTSGCGHNVQADAGSAAKTCFNAVLRGFASGRFAAFRDELRRRSRKVSQEWRSPLRKGGVIRSSRIASSSGSTWPDCRTRSLRRRQRVRRRWKTAGP